MDNKNNQNNFPGNAKNCPGGKNEQNNNTNKGQQKKQKREEF